MLPHRFSRCSWLALSVACGTHAFPRPAAGPTPSDPLSAIIGVWQSDTTAGVSALSACAWTPNGLAVVCDQRVTLADGTERRVTNLFARDSIARAYVFYGMPTPGQSLSPVPLRIANHVWVYGGVGRDARGVLHRTVNDFTARDAYTWRAESSTDGTHWTVVAHGRSTRVPTGM